MLMNFIVLVLLIAFAASSVVGFLRVSRIFDAHLGKLPAVVFKAYTCDFCLCFWVALVMSLFVAILQHDTSYLLIPLFSTQISKNLL